MVKKKSEQEAWKRFCEYYAAGAKKVEAYARAYPSDTRTYQATAAAATRLLKKPEVKAYYESLIADIKSDNIADATEILETITELMRNKKGSARDRLRAAELLAKKHGLLREKIEVSGTLSIAESLKAARQRAERRGK